MKLHLPVLLRKALLACFAFAFACSATSAAADLTLGGDASLTIDYADTDSIPDLEGGTLRLNGDTILQLLNCGEGDGKTYTLLTGVSELVDKEGNVLAVGSYSLDELFDTTQPGSGFWADGTLVYAADGTLRLVRHNVTVKDALIVKTHQEDPNAYAYYTSLSFENISYTSTTGGVFGGAIYRANDTSITMSNNGSVVFERNTASSTGSFARGGAINGWGEITLSSNGSVVFAGNTASGGSVGGGAICGERPSKPITLSNNGSVVFEGNMANASSAAYGGAIYSYGDIMLRNNGSVVFDGNTAFNAGSALALGGAIRGYVDSTIGLSNNGSVIFSGNTASGGTSKGGAIYGEGDITLRENGSVTFSGNTAFSTPTYRYASGGAIYGDEDITLSNNGSVVFDGNTASSYDSNGGAIYGGWHSFITLNNNGSVVFEGNAVISSRSSYGGAIKMGSGGGFYIENNQSVVFKGNYTLQRSVLKLQSIYASDSDSTQYSLLVSFSAPENGRIEFRDSIDISLNSNSASAFHLNNWYENDAGAKVAQTGDIIFTGADATAENLKAILAAHGINREATADEIRLSKTSEVRGTMQLRDGRLIIRDGAVLAADGITVKSSVSGRSTPTLWLHNGELTSYSSGENTLSFESGTAFALSGQNDASNTAITFATDSSFIITLDATHEATAALTLTNSTLTLPTTGTLTLQLNTGETLLQGKSYALLRGISMPTGWERNSVTVTSGTSGWDVSWEDLSWVDNTLWLYYDTRPDLVTATWTNESKDGKWNTTSVNWEQDELDYEYRDGVAVIFGDAGCGSVTLESELKPESVLVNNAAGKDYVFSGSGSLVGSMKLTKQGEGTLIINTSNDYSGGTEIMGGVLIAKNAHALGTGGVILHGGKVIAGHKNALGTGSVTLNGGTLEIGVAGITNSISNTGKSTLRIEDGVEHVLYAAIANSAELSLEGTFDATNLATAIGETHIDANGQEGNSGFLKTAGKEVDIMSGSGTLVNNGTVSIDGTTVALDSSGYGKTGAELQLGTYTIVDGTHSVAAILDKSTSANIILNAGGTLTADASTNELTATGGVINMNEAIELGGSISGAVLNVSAGKLTATLEGENTLNANGWQMSQTITNTGTLKLTGTVDATALATTIDETHIDAYGQEGNSGFLKTAGKEVDIMSGSGTLVNNGAVSIDGTTVTLDSTGYGKTGAELQLGTYAIVDGTHSVAAILGKSATADIILNAGGTLTADASTDALTATGGIINMNEAIELGGSISGAVLNVSAGKLAATLEGENTLNATGWLLNHTITNNGTLTLTGTVDATALATVIAQTHIDANGQEGNSGFLKTAGKEVDIMTGSGTLVNNGTISIDGSTVVLDSTGYGKIGAELQLGTYTIVDGTHSLAAILDKSASADIILNAGGTLTVDASTEALTATGGVINMIDAIELGGSISGAELNVSAGKLAASLDGENTLNATDWDISQTIINNGTLTLTGSVDASGLSLNTKAEDRVNLAGEAVSLTQSGFNRGVEYSVQIVAGGKTVDAGVSIVHDAYLSRTQLVLGEDGVARAGAEVDYTHFFLTGGDSAEVSKIAEVSAHHQETLTGVTMDSGELTIDLSVAVSATGGSIVLTEAAELSGAIDDTAVSTGAGNYTGTISAVLGGRSSLAVGGGNIIVSGANSYTGGTTVNGGALVADNGQAFGTGDVVVNGATLDLNQFSIANKVFMNGSSTLSYADGASHIVLGSEAAVNFRNGYTLGSGKCLTVAGPASYTGALTLGGGTLELDGLLTVRGDVEFVNGATTTLDISGWKGLGDGDVLVDFGSSNSGYADGCLSLEGTAGDWELAFDAATGVLTLLAVKDEPEIPDTPEEPEIPDTPVEPEKPAPVKLVWAGEKKSVWKVGAPGWENQKFFNNGAEVSFVNGGTVTIEGKVAPGAISVNNHKNLTFKSKKKTPGSISGEGDLTKRGAGTLTLNDGNSSWTGDTHLYAGTIKVKGATSLGKGDVYLKGGTLNLRSKAIANDIIQSRNATIKSGKKFTGSYTLEQGELQKGSTLNIAKTATLEGGTVNGTLSGNGTVTVTGEVKLGDKGKIKTRALTLGDGAELSTSVKGLNSKSTSLCIEEDASLVLSGKLTAASLEVDGGTLKTYASKPVAISVQKDMTLTDAVLATSGKVTANKLTLNASSMSIKGAKAQSLTVKQSLTIGIGSNLSLNGKLSTGSLTLKSGATLTMSGSKPVTLKVKGALTLNSGSSIILDYDFVQGKTYKILTFGSLSGVSGVKDLHDVFGVDNENCVFENTGKAITLTVTGKWNPQTLQKAVSAATSEGVVFSSAPKSAGNPVADALVQSNWGQLEASRAFVNAMANRSMAVQLGNGERAVWASAIGSSSRHSSAGGHAGADTNVSGGVFGLETQVGRASLFGMALGNSWTRVSAHGFGTIEQDTTHLGLYGQTNWRSGVTADWSAAYGRSDSETMGSDWNQKHLQLDGRMSYNHELNARTVLSPFAGVQYYASDAATVDGTDTGSLQNLRAEIGVAASHRTGKLGVFGEIAVHQDLARSNPTVSMEGARYTGMNPGRMGINFTIGASYELSDKWSMNASYTGEVVENANAHSANIGATYKF